MTVKIRLARHGRKKHPYYRVVAADIQRSRDGKFIEILGTYDPNQEPAEVKLQMDRVNYWLGQGAKATDTVKSLIRKVPAESDG